VESARPVAVRHPDANSPLDLNARFAAKPKTPRLAKTATRPAKTASKSTKLSCFLNLINLL